MHCNNIYFGTCFSTVRTVSASHFFYKTYKVEKAWISAFLPAFPKDIPVFVILTFAVSFIYALASLMTGYFLTERRAL